MALPIAGVCQSPGDQLLMFGPGFVPSHFVFQPQFSLLFAINPALREILLILSISHFVHPPRMGKLRIRSYEEERFR
jgi:hypothetical protein